MAYVVSATWTARAGEEATIEEVLRTMTPLSRAEEGCLYYQSHRSVDDPRVFYLYEQYVDESGYQAHMASAHFQEHVIGRAIPSLEDRERAFFETLDF